MNKRLPPYGKEFKSRFPYLAWLFIGEPECWQEVKARRQQGHYNNLALPQMADADSYQWPLSGLTVIAIDFSEANANDCDRLISAAEYSGAKSLSIRQLPDEAVSQLIFLDVENAA